MWVLYWSVVVKKELSVKAKLSVYQSVYVPTLTCEPWVVTERVRLLIQVVEIGRGAWSQCRATTYQKDTVGHLGWMPPGRLKGEVLWTFSTGRKPQGRSRTFMSSAVLGRPHCGQGKSWERYWREGGLYLDHWKMEE